MGIEPCSHYPADVDVPTCAECITAQTSTRDRPRCAKGHPCVMFPSHRWVCTTCGEYAVERGKITPLPVDTEDEVSSL